MEKIKKIVLIGGHPTPAIALIDILEAEGGFEIHFFGRKHSTEGDKAQSLEYKLLKSRSGVIFYSITTGRLQRKFTRFTIISLIKIPFGLFQSIYLLAKIKPRIVIGFGGYLSVPVVIAAALFRIPIFIHEQTSIPGLSIKITSKFAKKIFVSFKSSASWFNQTKTVFSGNLIRKELLTPHSITNQKLREFLKLEHPLIYVTGGGQGSKVLNDFIIKNLSSLQKLKYRFIVQTGELQNSFAQKHLSNQLETDNELNNKFFVQPHFSSQEISAIMQSSPIIFARSGANTVTEILFFKLPAIFVPLDIAAGSEQLQNAKLFSKNNVAEVIFTKDLNMNNFCNSLNTLDKKFNKNNFKNLESEIKIDSDNVLFKEILRFLSS